MEIPQSFTESFKETPHHYTTTYTTKASRYGNTGFKGIVVDTGASMRSPGGIAQFKALQELDPSIELDTSTKGQVIIQVGIGVTSSLGSARVATPIGDVEFHIVDANTPFLLSLQDMDGLSILLDNLKGDAKTNTCSQTLGTCHLSLNHLTQTLVT